MESKAKDLTIYSNKDMSASFPRYDSATFSCLHQEGNEYEICRYIEKVRTTPEDVKEVLKRLMCLPLNDNASTFIVESVIDNCDGGSRPQFMEIIIEALTENALGQ